MSQQLRFCLRGGCTGIAVEGKYCAACVAAGVGKRVRSDYDRWYNLAAWKTLRLWKLRRFPLCEICLTKPSTDVHHTDDSWKKTGDWRLFMTLEKLMALCHECHSRITMKEHHV
jgi:hypothetical protein